MDETIVILGGGPCGLSAAWELAGHGRPVVVLEREDQLGGLCRTVQRGAFRFDLGGHRFITRDPELLARVQALMGVELLVAERRSVIRLDGRLYQYPLAARDLFRQVNPAFGIACLADYLVHNLVRRVRGADELSFERWVVNRFGRLLYRTFFEPYTAKLWGRSPATISADWAAQRISLLNLWDVARRLMGRGDGVPRTYARQFFYPREGIGQIFRRMGEEIAAAGGEVHCGAQVHTVEVDGRRVLGVGFTEDGAERFLRCGTVISTIPLPDLCRALRPGVGPELSASVEQLRFRSMRFLNIMLEGPDFSENTWTYVPEPRYLMTRIQEPKRRSPHSAPPGRTSLILEIPCDAGDALWSTGDEALLERCLADLEEMGWPLGPRVLGCFSTRAEHAYPTYSLDYRAHCGRLLLHLRQHTDLITCGRQGLFRYVFMDTAMQMGFAAAGAILGRGSRRSVEDAGLDQRLVEAQAIGGRP
ncbi:MAG: FAD-dependent oxidoreductase [Nitrospinota bacterium]